jgi:hypothetical protein
MLVLWWCCQATRGVSPLLERKEMVEELPELPRALLCSGRQNKEGGLVLWRMSSVLASPF